MTKEALRLALDALENLFGIPDKWTGEGGGDVAVWRLGGSYRAQQAITAIKEALAQPEQPKVRTGDCLRVGVCASEGHKIAPQRKPLTDEEIAELWDETVKYAPSEIRIKDFARAIEAAIWEKQK